MNKAMRYIAGRVEAQYCVNGGRLNQRRIVNFDHIQTLKSIAVEIVTGDYIPETKPTTKLGVNTFTGASEKQENYNIFDLCEFLEKVPFSGNSPTD